MASQVLSTKQAKQQLPKIVYCDERTRLLNKFLVAIQDVVALNDQQTQSVIEGDPDFARFDLLMGMATRQKNVAKYAWLKHIEEHGC